MACPTIVPRGATPPPAEHTIVHPGLLQPSPATQWLALGLLGMGAAEKQHLWPRMSMAWAGYWSACCAVQASRY